MWCTLDEIRLQSNEIEIDIYFIYQLFKISFNDNKILENLFR